MVDSTFKPAQFEIRLLDGSESDTAAYRALRSKIRHSDGARNFADSYTREDALHESAWGQWCNIKRDHFIVGTFDKGRGNKLVSIMMVTAQGRANSPIAEWEATWVEPEYRGSGIARRAYEKVKQVTKEFGYQHAVVFIRQDNHHSCIIRKAQGFAYLHTKKNEHWADGSIADTNLFILDLFPNCSIIENPHERTIHRLEESLEFLKGSTPFIEDGIKKRITDLRIDIPQQIEIWPLTAQNTAA